MPVSIINIRKNDEMTKLQENITWRNDAEKHKQEAEQCKQEIEKYKQEAENYKQGAEEHKRKLDNSEEIRKRLEQENKDYQDKEGL